MKHITFLLFNLLITHLELVTAMSNDQNLLINEVISSSETTHGWTRRQRTSYWIVSETGDDLFMAENGCLCFKPTKEQSYFSQFLSFGEDMAMSNQGLVVHASLNGTDTTNIAIKLYMRYTDGLLFKLTLDFSSHAQSISSFIPNYGAIKTIAVYVILEKEAKHPTCVCDMTLKFSPSSIPGFPVYKNTFPIQRHVISYFITPSDELTNGYSDVITIATQLTVDRLDNLERMAKRWKGPVSAAILVMGQQKQYVSEIVRFYSFSDVLSRYVTLHLVFEDALNGNDDTSYPVNFLRNVALTYAKSDQIFPLDVDLIPGFNMSEAAQWSTEADSDLCTKCVFVAPLYQVEHYFQDYPSNKSQLLELLRQQDSPIKPFGTISHGVVNFKKWERSDQIYQIQYQQDIEPYFITDSKAPLINDVYSGYGRDKCAYSRDLHHMEYQFVVLPKAFLIDVKHKSGGQHPRIYDRSKGVQLNMFLNIDFHKWEINKNHLTYKTSNKDFGVDTNEGSCRKHQNNDESHERNHWTNRVYEPDEQRPKNEKVADYLDVLNISEEKQNDVLSPTCQTLVPDDVDIPDLPYLVELEHETRDDVIAERLIRRYQTGHVIIMPHVTGSGLMGYLHFVHPDSVTIISPSPGPFQQSKTGQFEAISGTGDVSSLLTFSREKNKGASLIFIFSRSMAGDNIINYTAAAIQTMTTEDILVLLGEPEILLDVLKTSTFCNSTNLEVFSLKVGTLIKPKELEIKDCPVVPKPPLASLDQCTSSPKKLKTDVILMTRNRPLQTLAFLQSLSIMGSGISKVWVQYRADDEVFTSGYNNAVNCVSDSLNIQLVNDKKDGFGKTLRQILTKSTADYVVLAVDEMVWLRPMDLQVAACLMYNQRDIASFQLRLGENIGVHQIIKNKHLRIFPVKDLAEFSIFYPLRMPYDFGYVLNVDGTMMNISMLLEDFGDWLGDTNHPGELESRWMNRKIHTRAHQWHLMYKESRLVNNALNTDGRVIGQTTPVDGSYKLANLMLQNKKQISISDFISANAMHSSTHITKDVVYEDLKC